MKYVSIDIETTGLSPEEDQILEFGAVIDDTLHHEVPVEELPAFRRAMLYERITGSPAALAMNSQLIAAMASALADKDKRAECCRPSTLANQFAKFLGDNGILKSKSGRFEYVAAGKNFGVFDRLFLDRLPHWKNIHQPFRRVLDPASLYFDPLKDEKPPSLSECLERAGLDPVVKHAAVDDARDVVRLLRFKFAEKCAAES